MLSLFTLLHCLSLCERMRWRACRISGIVVRCDIVVFRTGRHGSLEIDGFSFVEGESGGVLRMLNTPGNMFIGESHISCLIRPATCLLVSRKSLLNTPGNMFIGKSYISCLIRPATCLLVSHISHA